MSYALTIVQKFFPKVEKVHDAKRGVKIEVTKADASSKAARDHVACAMAVACQRSFKLDGVVISRTTAYLIKRNMATRFLVPVTVGREVVAFDRGGGFSPGKYHLSPVPKSRRIGGRKDPTGSRTVTGKKHKYRHVTDRVRAWLGSEEE